MAATPYPRDDSSWCATLTTSSPASNTRQMPSGFGRTCGRVWQEFALTLAPGKTRLIAFGHHAAKNRRARGLGKPETFSFLGFTHISGHNRREASNSSGSLAASRVRARLQVIKETLRRKDAYETVDEQGAWLRRVVMGFNAYHAVPTNAAALSGTSRHNVANLWRRIPRRRGQKGGGDVGADDRASKSMASKTAYHPSLARETLSPSNTQGGSPVREYRPPGSGRGLCQEGAQAPCCTKDGGRPSGAAL